jgi:hypothetical protein
MPENSDFEPIRVDLKLDQLLIEGVVVGVLRRGIPQGASRTSPMRTITPGKGAAARSGS